MMARKNVPMCDFSEFPYEHALFCILFFYKDWRASEQIKKVKAVLVIH